MYPPSIKLDKNSIGRFRKIEKLGTAIESDGGNQDLRCTLELKISLL